MTRNNQTYLLLSEQVAWAHGLCAAYVAGLLMIIGDVGLLQLGDCFDMLAFGSNQLACFGVEPEYALRTFGLLVNGGTLVSLPAAVGVSALASRIRHSRQRLRP